MTSNAAWTQLAASFVTSWYPLPAFEPGQCTVPALLVVVILLLHVLRGLSRTQLLNLAYVLRVAADVRVNDLACITATPEKLQAWWALLPTTVLITANIGCEVAEAALCIPHL